MAGRGRRSWPSASPPNRSARRFSTRTGQCLMTCPTTAVYDGLPASPVRAPLGRLLRFFGDGNQQSKLIGGRRYWRIPVMDGEFLVEQSLGVEKGVGGGNLLIQGKSLDATLEAARRGVAADRAVARCHHAVSRRRRSQRQQGRLAIQGPEGIDGRGVLPDAPRRGREPLASGGQLLLGDRDRRDR